MRRTVTLILAVVACLEFAGAQGFQPQVLSNVVTSAWNSAAGDFDGDGDLDLIVSSGEPGTAMFWVESLPAGQRVTRVFSVGSGDFRHCVAGDFNHDGFDDAVVGDFDDSSFVLLTSTGLGGLNPFTASILRYPARLPYAVQTADLNADGYDDLVAAQHNGNVISIYLQRNGALHAVFDIGQIFHPSDLAIVDYDRDGDQDVLGASDGHGIFWLEQENETTYVRHTLIDNNELAYAIGGGDLDGDGDVDIAVGYRTSARQRVIWYEHDSITDSTEHVLNGAFGIPRGIVVADFDTDNDLDLAAVSRDGPVRWWRNEGSRVFAEVNLFSGMRPYALVASDFDDDGDADLIVTDHDGSQVTLLTNTLGMPAVILGTVRAATGGDAVSGISIRLVQNSVFATSDASGRFALLTAGGTYTVVTSSPCWADTSVSEVQVARAETTVVDLSLRRPLASIATTSLNFIAQNQAITSVPLPVSNLGDSPLRVQATLQGNLPEDEWLFVIPEELAIPAGESMSFEVRVEPDTSNTQAWDYFGSILLRTDACPDSLVEVFVNVYVLDAEHRPGPLPGEFAITSVYPNPFNSNAKISFALPHAAQISLTVRDIAGRRVDEIAHADFPAGTYTVGWDGSRFASGVYLLSLETGSHRSLYKMVMLK